MALCSVGSNVLAGFCSDKTWRKVEMLLLGNNTCLRHWLGMSRIHSLSIRGLEVVLALKMSFQECAWGLPVYNVVNTVLRSFQNWSTSPVTLIQEQRMHSQFSLTAEVNNEMKYSSKICIYHLQKALPNNQWQLGWQANFRVKPRGIQVYFRFTVDSKGQRKNKLSSSVMPPQTSAGRAETKLWPSISARQKDLGGRAALQCTEHGIQMNKWLIT